MSFSMMCPRSSMFLTGADLLSAGGMGVGTSVCQITLKS